MEKCVEVRRKIIGEGDYKNGKKNSKKKNFYIKCNDGDCYAG